MDKTKINNLAYAFDNEIDTSEYNKLKFSINVLKRAIINYEKRAKTQLKEVTNK